MKRVKFPGAVALAVLALIGSLIGSVSGAPLDSKLQTQLLALYDRWIDAAGAGKFSDAAALSVPELRDKFEKASKNKQEIADVAAMARAMTPDRIEPLHANLPKDGRRATIYARVTKNFPVDPKMPDDGAKPEPPLHLEMTLKFALDGQDWKVEEPSYGANLDDIHSCGDDAIETEAAYDRGRTVNSHGLIRRVAFTPDQTLLVYRLSHEEQCAILPPKERLAKIGVDPAMLMPYATVEIAGYAHETDEQRIWARDVRVTPED